MKVKTHPKSQKNVKNQNSCENLLENLPHGLYVLDENKNFQFVNPVGAQIAGYTPQELVGRPFSLLFRPEMLPELNEHLLRVVVDGEERCNFETEIIRKDASRAFVNFGLSSCSTKDGKSCSIWTVEDISWRKRAEETIRASEDKYRELIKTSLDAMISVDEQMTIVLWNPAAARMYPNIPCRTRTSDQPPLLT